MVEPGFDEDDAEEEEEVLVEPRFKYERILNDISKVMMIPI